MTKSLISEVLVSNDYAMICILNTVVLSTGFTFTFCIQDEMKLMKEEHENELQELKVRQFYLT